MAPRPDTKVCETDLQDDTVSHIRISTSGEFVGQQPFGEAVEHAPSAPEIGPWRQFAHRAKRHEMVRGNRPAILHARDRGLVDPDPLGKLGKAFIRGSPDRAQVTPEFAPANSTGGVALGHQNGSFQDVCSREG